MSESDLRTRGCHAADFPPHDGQVVRTLSARAINPLAFIATVVVRRIGMAKTNSVSLSQAVSISTTLISRGFHGYSQNADKDFNVSLHE